MTAVLASDDRAALEAAFGDRVRFDEPLAAHTWWRIGGPADALVTAESEADIARLLPLAFKRKLPWFVLGSGSNLLVGDGGIRGIVVKLAGTYGAIDVADDAAGVYVTAGGAAAMPALTAQAASRGAIGIGALAGIPGTVGGAVRMNAGTDRETGEFVRDVWVQTAAKPEPHAVSVQYFYRHTTVARDALVARVRLAFAKGVPAAVREEMQARLVRRKATQPVGLPNAGSCFRNPEGDTAGRLIEELGAKGWSEGGAEVSPLHANFITNVGGATALDVTRLLARVRRGVEERFGVALTLEVHLVGEFVAET
jgi:UDP-N-acetylmuramate dehydrogenase